MDVDPLQMARPGSSDDVVDTRGGHASSSRDQHSRVVHMSKDVQSERYNGNLQQMGAVFHEVMMIRLRGPVGCINLWERTSHLYKLSTELCQTDIVCQVSQDCGIGLHIPHVLVQSLQTGMQHREETLLRAL